MRNSILNGDCLELMKDIPDGSVDMILCDLPYGTTQNKWDSVIPFDALWSQYNRVIKKNGTIVLTSAQPFTSALISSNYKQFKYCWIWEKDAGTGFLNAKKQPLRSYEDICIFSKESPTYYPQMEPGKPYSVKKGGLTSNYNPDSKAEIITENTGERYPKSVIKINRDKDKIHPTQKPVPLFEYLIKTYTLPGELVLDNCAGSGTTGIACRNTGRDYILIEKDPVYYDIIWQRMFPDIF